MEPGRMAQHGFSEADGELATGQESEKIKHE